MTLRQVRHDPGQETYRLHSMHVDSTTRRDDAGVNAGLDFCVQGPRSIGVWLIKDNAQNQSHPWQGRDYVRLDPHDLIELLRKTGYLPPGPKSPVERLADILRDASTAAEPWNDTARRLLESGTVELPE